MKEILKAAVEKNFATFETLVKEQLHRKAAVLVEAYTPVVSAKIIAEADTVVKHTGGEYVFEDGTSAEISREDVKAFVEAVSGRDDYYAIIEAASSSKNVFEAVKNGETVETQSGQTPTEIKESVLKSLRPVVYTPTLNEMFKTAGDAMAGVMKNLTHPLKVKHKTTGATGRVSDEVASKPDHKVVVWDTTGRQEVHKNELESIGR